MHVTAQQLIQGASVLDRMKSELDQVTKLLFWLARNKPRLWIHNQNLKSPYGWDFKTTFGSINDGQALWEVWYALGGVPSGSRPGFRARCLFQTEGKLWQAYSTAHREEKLPTGLGQEFLPVSEIQGVEGIQFARENLDIFVTGMMYEFPLGIPTKPYVRAAQLAL